ncbi:Spo0E family sporulation regulatory protein-aspartic acid phosphatase [Alkaliphilus oremlandii]|uniref:Spo0E family sporulation regulatory protein-aspartic acid phosphatase n=1 Tax=Alkaliphilus oremlandii TaxID=461876 RepID=UPI000317EB2F|nr:Spo0E family sporulation regulatory protein-aspartic acid phosphatase [Alkaliphilus oremlandii]
MKSREKCENEINALKNRLHKMLEGTNGTITEDIVEISQKLDVLILQATKKNNYNHK